MESQDSNARPANVEPGFNNVTPNETSALPVVVKPDIAANVPPPRPSRKKLLLLGAGIVVLVGAGAALLWHGRHPAPKATALTNISVRLAWVNNPEFAGMYMAEAKGYYKAVGLNVDLKEFQDSTDVNKEVADGVVNYGVSTPLEIVLARDKAEKNKAIAAIYQTSSFSFVSKKAANITTPSDFKGKVLGKSGDNNEAAVTYAALMAYADVAPGDATTKGIDFDVLKAFNDSQSDVVDVFRTDQTYLLNQAHIPYNQILPEEFGFSIYGDVLIASDSTIAHKPAQTSAFVSATLKGWQYALDHQAETLTVLAKNDNVLYKDPAYAKYDLTSTVPLIKPTGNQSIGNMQYVPWNRAYEAVKTAGLLKTGFNTTDTYTNQFVE